MVWVVYDSLVIGYVYYYNFVEIFLFVLFGGL